MQEFSKYKSPKENNPNRIIKKILPLHIKFFYRMESVIYKKEEKWMIGNTTSNFTRVTSKVGVYKRCRKKQIDSKDHNFDTFTSFDRFMKGDLAKEKKRHSDVDLNDVEYKYDPNESVSYKLYLKSLKTNKYNANINNRKLVRYMIGGNL